MRSALLLCSILFWNTHCILGQNENPIYIGRWVKGNDNCTDLIHIIAPKEDPFYDQYIIPTSLPQEIRRWKKFEFTFVPLRQPVPNGCKARVVGSIQILPER